MPTTTYTPKQLQMMEILLEGIRQADQIAYKIKREDTEISVMHNGNFDPKTSNPKEIIIGYNSQTFIQLSDLAEAEIDDPAAGTFRIRDMRFTLEIRGIVRLKTEKLAQKTLKVSFFQGNKEKTLHVDDAILIYDNVDVPGEKGPNQLQIKGTHEGVISDIWVSRKENLDHNYATKSQTTQEIIDHMVESNK